MISFFGVKNIDELDFRKLVRDLPAASGSGASNRRAYVRAILESYPAMLEYGINTPQRLAHFIGQGVVETAWLTARAENLNYSFEALKSKWSHKFNDEAEMRAYARKADKIGNRIYANRMWNGPEESGDGFRYRGRGFFQITGKENYTKFGEIAGVDLVGDPEALGRDLKLSVRVAAAYFKHVGLGEFADSDNISAVSRGIQRGAPRSPTPALHEADRISWTRKAQALVRDPAGLLITEAAAGVSTTFGIGSTGEAVAEVQRWLAALGYAVGMADGIYGPATRRAVLAFQDEHELPATGAVDAATRLALQRELGLVPPEPVATPEPPPQAPGESPADAPPLAHVEPPPEVAAPSPIPESSPVAETQPAPDAVTDAPRAATEAEAAPAEPRPTEAQPPSEEGPVPETLMPPPQVEPPTAPAPPDTPEPERPA